MVAADVGAGVEVGGGVEGDEGFWWWGVEGLRGEGCWTWYCGEVAGTRLWMVVVSKVRVGFVKEEDVVKSEGDRGESPKRKRGSL